MGLLDRLMYNLFVCNEISQMVDIVMESLRLTPRKISELLLMDDTKFSMAQMVRYNVLAMFQKLESIIDEHAFVKLILKYDEKNKNALEQALGQKKESKAFIIEYFVSFDGVKKEYESNEELMGRCVYYMAEGNDESVVSVILTAFNWNKEKLKEIQSYDEDVTNDMIKKLLNAKK